VLHHAAYIFFEQVIRKICSGIQWRMYVHGYVQKTFPRKVVVVKPIKCHFPENSQFRNKFASVEKKSFICLGRMLPISSLKRRRRGQCTSTSDSRKVTQHIFPATFQREIMNGFAVNQEQILMAFLDIKMVLLTAMCIHPVCRPN
jgi:hypothetical protein